MASPGVLIAKNTAIKLDQMATLYSQYGWPKPDGSLVYPRSDSEALHFTNDSGETVPAYACMVVTGVQEIGDRNYLVIDKPTTPLVEPRRYIFNGPYSVPDKEEGTAQTGDYLQVFKNTGTVTFGDRWAVTNNQWYLTKNETGVFVVIGEDEVDDDVFRVQRDEGLRLFRFTLNASLSSGTADADILEMDGTDTTTDANVLDPAGIFASLTTVGDDGICVQQDGKYYVIQANCTG